MSHIISLKCFKESSSTESVDLSLLESVVAKQQNLILQREGNLSALLIWKEKQSKWCLLLWITPGNYAYINSAPILQSELYHDLVVVAESINAFIISEEGVVLFIPQQGLLFDSEERQVFKRELEELNAEMEKTGNIALAMETIVARRTEQNYHTLKAYRLYQMIQIGQWKGYYNYFGEKVNKFRQFENTNFDIEILTVDGNHFTGKVQDDLDTGGAEGVGDITGQIHENRIDFVKAMPVLTLIVDEKGTRKIFNKKHPPIFYTGEFSSDARTVNGTWQIRFGIVWFGIIPLPIMPLKGAWSMTLQPHEYPES